MFSSSSQFMSSQYPQWLRDYKFNLQHVETSLTSNKGKYSFIYHFYQTGDIDLSVKTAYIDPLFVKIAERQKDCDFDIAELIRCLYVDFEEDKRLINVLISNYDSSCVETDKETTSLNYSRIERSYAQLIEIDKFKEEILRLLEHFPFWPEEIGKDSTVKNNKNLSKLKNMNNLVFWTESHLFLMLGSAFLYFQYVLQIRPLRNGDTFDSKISKSNNESKQCERVKGLLLHYLKLHFPQSSIDGDGDPFIFESNACIYNARSICALLNLYDFSFDEEIRSMSEKLVDHLVYQVMLCTDPTSGIANLSASTRHAPRLFQRNNQHGINQLVKIMNGGTNIDPYEPNYISSFLLTSSWIPKENAFVALHELGEVCFKKRFSPILSNEKIVLEHIPFYWSFGVMTDSAIIEMTKRYVDRYGLNDNKDLWPLHMWGSPIISSFKDSNQYTHLTMGQRLLDVKLTVYKMPNLVLSSFDLYNCHYVGFQQVPWCANVGGFPVYSRTGPGMSTKTMLRFGMENTHMPAVQQRRSLLVATYVTPSSLLFRQTFSTSVQLFWPFRRFIHIHGLRYRQSEALQPVDNATWSSINKAQDEGSKSGKVAQNKRYAWIVGYHNGVFIGCLFTRFPAWENSGESDFFTVINQDGLSTNRTCSLAIVNNQEVVSLVVIVGSKMEYSSMMDFVDGRLNHVKITETIGSDTVKSSLLPIFSGSAKNNEPSRRMYNITVEDIQESMEILVKYTCDLNNPHDKFLTSKSPTDRQGYEPIARDIISGDKSVEVNRYNEARFPFQLEDLLRAEQLIEIPSKWITLEQTLGEGGFGMAIKGRLMLPNGSTNVPNTVEVAVKFLKNSASDDVDATSRVTSSIFTSAITQVTENHDRILHAFVNEMALVKIFANVPYVVQCYGYIGHSDHGHGLVLELAPYGSLSDVIRMPCYRDYILGSIEENKKFIFAWLKDICAALIHLHRLGIIHQDLKPGNVLLFQGLKIKLSDFGISRRIEEKRSAGGTTSYQAPELRMLGNGKPVFASDIFSLAMTAIALFKGSTPQIGFQEEIEKYVCHHDTKIGERIVALIRACAKYELEIENYGRPNATTVFAQLNNLEKDDNGAGMDSITFECLLSSS